MLIDFRKFLRKWFTVIPFAPGTSSDPHSVFVTKCERGEGLHHIADKRFFIADKDADATDATTTEIATLKGNSLVIAASPTLDMTFNNRVIPVDASSNAVDFQVADDEFTAGFRCILEVKDGTNNISITRSGSTATINGGTTKSYTTPTAYTHIYVTCSEDNELVVSKSDP